jgi:Spy/CpxP family protein refolding chaperone
VTITKFGFSRRALGLGVIALALTVPLAAGQTRSQTGQATAAGQPQGRQTAAPQPQVAAPPTGPSRPGQRPFDLFRREWWKDDQVKKEIGLTDDKARKIDNIFQDRSKRLAPIVDELEKQEAELDRLTRDRVVDEVTYSLQAGRVWDLRRRFGESRTIMLYRIFLELTPDQYKKLEALRERNRGGRGGGSR